MRFIILSCLLLITVTVFRAQEIVIMPDDLPEPILVDERLLIADPHQLVWLNVSTGLLAFELRSPLNEADNVVTSYSYRIADNFLYQNEHSIFQLDLSPQLREQYQVTEDVIIFQSPYSITSDSADVSRQIIYTSDMLTNCGIECNPFMIMVGEFNFYRTEQGEFYDNTYYPVDFRSHNEFIVHWGWRQTALVKTAPYFSNNGGLYLVDINTANSIEISTSLHQDDRTLAISDDGRQVAYTSFTRSPQNNDFQRSISIWTAPYHDEGCGCTYDANLYYITPEIINSERDIHFAGVGFVDENTILYIGELGLIRHNLQTGISTILDPELNVGWIRTAVFSQNSRHVAVTSEDGLYILPLHEFFE